MASAASADEDDEQFREILQRVNSSRLTVRTRLLELPGVAPTHQTEEPDTPSPPALPAHDVDSDATDATVASEADHLSECSSDSSSGGVATPESDSTADSDSVGTPTPGGSSGSESATDSDSSGAMTPESSSDASSDPGSDPDSDSSSDTGSGSSSSSGSDPDPDADPDSSSTASEEPFEFEYTAQLRHFMPDDVKDHRNHGYYGKMRVVHELVRLAGKFEEVGSTVIYGEDYYDIVAEEEKSTINVVSLEAFDRLLKILDDKWTISPAYFHVSNMFLDGLQATIAHKNYVLDWFLLQPTKYLSPLHYDNERHRRCIRKLEEVYTLLNGFRHLSADWP